MDGLDWLFHTVDNVLLFLVQNEKQKMCVRFLYTLFVGIYSIY